jgi:hypothetical protein
MEKLIQERVTSIAPRIDFKAMKGALVADVVVTCHNSELKDRLDMEMVSRLGPHKFRIGWGGEKLGHYTFGVPGVAAAGEIVDWVRSIDGIAAVKLDFIYDLLQSPGAYDELVPTVPRKRGPES